MFDMNRRYNWPIVPQIVLLIGDQTCTFQCSIPSGDLSKYDQRGRKSPSGYGPLVAQKLNRCSHCVMTLDGAFMWILTVPLLASA